jgi:hypothetical protein
MTSAPTPEESVMTTPTEPRPALEGLTADVNRLQDVQPVTALPGHEVCGDVHTALTVAQTVLDSRDQRAFASPEREASDSLVRELRALGVMHATPQLVAMVAVIDAAVDQLAEVGTSSRQEAWTRLRQDVLRRYCSAPDTDAAM